MAHTRQEIIVGGQKAIGSVEIDSSRVTARGGSTRPQLVVPLGVDLHRHEVGQEQIGLVRLRAWLSKSQMAGRETAISDVVDEATGLEMAVTTTTYERTTPFIVPLAFPMTGGELAELEGWRLSQPDGQVTLWMGLQLDLAALKTTEAGALWTGGIASYWAHLWQVSVRPVELAVSQQTWIQSVLPEVGYDRSRLVEIRFPEDLQGSTSPATEFDRALAALNQRRFDDCVAACRHIVELWNKHYGANKSTQMGDAIGDARRWSADDERRSMVSAAWKVLIDATNAAHHRKEGAPGHEFDRADAKMLLFQIAVMSEYLS